MTKQAVIYDLDGTLIDVSERLSKSLEEAGVQSLEAASDTEYDKVMEIFNSKKYIDLDKPKENVINELRTDADNYYVIIMTGRPKQMDRITKKQLYDFDIPYDEIIHVNEDVRDVKFTSENKRKEVQKLATQYDIVKFVDDMEDNLKAVAEVIGEDKVKKPEDIIKKEEKETKTEEKIEKETEEKEIERVAKKTPEQEITEFALGRKKE